MQKNETLDEFYSRHASLGHIVPVDGAGITSNTGQFNVFRREAFYSKQTPYNRRDFYKISLVIGEHGTLYYADKWIEINRNALVFFNPLIPHSWETASETHDGYFCLFTEAFIAADKQLNDLPFFQIGADPVFFLNDLQTAFLTSLFEHMLAEIGSEYKYKFDLLRNYVGLLVHEALKMKPVDSYFTYTNASSRITSLFLDLLELQFPVDSTGHILKLKSANDYALHLSVHVNHLNRAVKEVTGHTTSKLIADRIIREALLLLKNTAMPIAEIAYCLGFEYASYFNSFFKKQTTKTPLSFRE
jgi:AraC family transcriptional regulator, transcriptional activator of pobA